MKCLPEVAACHVLGLRPKRFSELVSAGVFRRRANGFEIETLVENYARALEVERRADAQIAMIRRAASRRLAAIGNPPPERKLP